MDIPSGSENHTSASVERALRKAGGLQLEIHAENHSCFQVILLIVVDTKTRAGRVNAALLMGAVEIRKGMVFGAWYIISTRGSMDEWGKVLCDDSGRNSRRNFRNNGISY